MLEAFLALIRLVFRLFDEGVLGENVLVLHVLLHVVRGERTGTPRCRVFDLDVLAALLSLSCPPLVVRWRTMLLLRSTIRVPVVVGTLVAAALRAVPIWVE